MQRASPEIGRAEDLLAAAIAASNGARAHTGAGVLLVAPAADWWETFFFAIAVFHFRTLAAELLGGVDFAIPEA
jgi:hypothetical protein